MSSLSSTFRRLPIPMLTSLFLRRFRHFLLHRRDGITFSSVRFREKDKMKLYQTRNESILELLSEKPKEAVTVSEKVKEKATNAFLYATLAASMAGLVAIGYMLFGELISVDSPQRIFSEALELVRNDPQCQDMFGPTIAGFGEETSRGRRRHIAHHKFEKDGKQRMRVLFHLKGSRAKGFAQAEKELIDGAWQWRFVIAQTEHPHDTCILIDNRST